MSPVEGNLEQLSTLKDKVFSSGAMGQGIAIQPKNGLIKAPDDGTIELVYPTGHAIGMKTKDGAEILIHIGMDTVNLNGKGFTTLVKQDQKVKKGDPLVKVDLKMIKESGYDTVTPVIVTNSASYHNIKTVPNGDIKYGQKILTLV
jgi:PTS system, glucose subfamily, IIA component